MLNQSNKPPLPSIQGQLPHDVAGSPAKPELKPTVLNTSSRGHSSGIPEGSYGYSSYSAVVTARFPDRESVLGVRQLLDGMHHPPTPTTLQWFEKELVENLWGDPLPGLAVGEHALIAQVTDTGTGEQIVQLCEAAGATRVSLYPVQRIFQ